jgi:hypothetical protein
MLGRGAISAVRYIYRGFGPNFVRNYLRSLANGIF